LAAVFIRNKYKIVFSFKKYISKGRKQLGKKRQRIVAPSAKRRSVGRPPKVVIERLDEPDSTIRVRKPRKSSVGGKPSQELNEIQSDKLRVTRSKSRLGHK
jgi:hypothetical protein